MLLESIKKLGETLVEGMLIKIEILSLDVKESGIRFLSVLMLGIFSLLLLTLGIILGIFWLIMTFKESDRLMVMGVLSVILLFCGIATMVFSIRKIKSGPVPFQSTISELNKDSEALGQLRPVEGGKNDEKTTA